MLNEKEAEPEHHRQRQGCALSCLTADVGQPMGYELHITRRKQWFDDGDDIAKEEFVAYVRSDKAELKGSG